MRAVALTLPLALGAALLVTAPAAATPQHKDRPQGWASVAGGTTGGAGGTEYVVRDRAELLAALDNGGSPTGRKIIRVEGTVNGHEAGDGTLLGEQDYAPGWDLGAYMACFVDGRTWSDTAHEWCKTQRGLRVEGSNAEKKQIQLTVPSNTTLVGEGVDAVLESVYLTVNTGSNIVVRNLRFKAPVDHFPSWSPDDGAQGSWNARFDAFTVVTGTHLWIDHCTFDDGDFPDGEAPAGFHGKPVGRHDGLLDLEDGTDYVTVSHSRFQGHDKTIMIGSGDGKGDRDRGHLRVTFHHNLFDSTQQRSPRVRFGQVHLYGNYFRGSVGDPDYPLVSQSAGGSSYFLGMGLESKIVSEANAFDYTGPGASPDITVANLKGNQLADRGSWFNGRPVNLVAVARAKYRTASAAAIAEAEAAGSAAPDWAVSGFTTDTGWDPADVYPYTVRKSAAAIRSGVLAHSGSGRGSHHAERG
ncbi:polysaccharide lyase family 1 protein [Streptomyces sp. QL37]|uniref:pectate lyase family protein n=1 Tax=Streptomyces sp. QL37 TaxID=2093747 RepID=UPI0021CB43C7|nr:pectate lyase [Streptomyces sp. QL37]